MKRAVSVHSGQSKRRIGSRQGSRKYSSSLSSLHALRARTRPGEVEVTLGDVMAHPRQRRRRLLPPLLVLLLSLGCLARLGGTASTVASAATRAHRTDGAATATEKAAGLQDAARGHAAAAAEEWRAVPARVEMEVGVEDYPGSAANARHEPGYGYPRGPQHP